MTKILLSSRLERELLRFCYSELDRRVKTGETGLTITLDYFLLSNRRHKTTDTMHGANVQRR